MNAPVIANLILIILEIIGISKSRSRGLILLIFYTQLSNIVTLISSVAYLISSGSPLTVALRYLSTVMLAMTVLITLFVLIPAGMGFADMMLSGNGLYHHTLCPAISIASYFLWEQHSSQWFIPVIVTLIYGIVMLYLNYAKIIEGPYPFFRVYEQSKKASVLWMIGLTAFISLISLAVVFLAR
ncbi:MAG: hypothetical protein E7219_06435 [Clostridiales bacterium]|nr:hypothetical protein [Clostridiales bacterium]